MKFTDCVEIVGKRVSSFDGEKRYISTGAVDVNRINEDSVEIITYEDRPSRADLSVSKGDVIFAKMAGTQKNMVIDEENEDNIYSTGFFAVRGKAKIISTKCLYYLVNSDLFFKQKDKHSAGATQKAITNKGLDNIIINVPCYSDQEKIVSQLDSVSLIIEERKKELGLLDNLTKARFVEMFGDTGTNPLGWVEHRLDEYIDFLTSGSRGWAKYFTDKGNELFITIKNVKNNHITLENIQYIDAPENKEAERTKVKAGDLLISITADLGRTGVVDEDIANMGAYINQHLSLVRLDKTKINPLYVSYFLETESGQMQFESKNQNGVKAGLNFDAIKSLKILVPPLEMQELYLDFVKQIDKSKVAVQQALDKTQLLFDSLMQKYFG